jgi:hypothetical protein
LFELREASRNWKGLALARRVAAETCLYSAAAQAEQKHVRELMAQSPEILKQMQAG